MVLLWLIFSDVDFEIGQLIDLHYFVCRLHIWKSGPVLIKITPVPCKELLKH